VSGEKRIDGSGSNIDTAASAAHAQSMRFVPLRILRGLRYVKRRFVQQTCGRKIAGFGFSKTVLETVFAITYCGHAF